MFVPVTRRTQPYRRFRHRAPWRRLSGPRAYLSCAIAAALAGLVLLPLIADAAAALSGARTVAGCRVLRVIDGDTVTLWCPGEGTQRVRLTGYDAPEKTSPRCPSELALGVAATWALRALLLRGGELSVRRDGRDRYGRVLAALSVDGRPVADRMVASGHGRRYTGGPREGWCG
jgi:endonuclease YncB( thermonuclease family)